MTPAKGEQQESPNSLGETEEPQRSGPGEHCTGELRQVQLLPLFCGASVPSSVPALLCQGGIHAHCCALQHSLGSASSCLAYLGYPVTPLRSPWALARGRVTQEGSLLPQSQHPGDASSSFSTWVATAQASGCAGEMVFPPAAPARGTEAAVEQGGAGANDAAALAPSKGPAPARPSISTEQHCSFRSPSHPVPIHPRAQSLKGGN